MKGGINLYRYERYELERKREEMAKQIHAGYELSNYDATHQSKYISLMSSMSHTYGNVLAFIQKWIIDLFPDNMFKTVHVNSKIAHRQIRSTEHEYIKKMKPMIIFRPRIAGVEEDRFLKGTELIERQVDIFHQWGGGNLNPFFDDPSRDLTIQYQLNRSVLYVDVVLLFSTLMQQIDYYHYISNAVRINHPFMVDTALESYLPQEMLSIISQCSGIPIYDSHNCAKDFVDYMNQNSMYPITFKLQGSTRTKEFYRYYPANIEVLISDLDKDDGEKENQIMDQYRISFTLRLEFNSTGFYFIFNDKIFQIKLPKVDPISADYIPVYTDVLLKEDLNLKPGWQMFNRGSFRLEVEDDVLNLDQLFNDSIREALKYHKENGLPLLDLIDIKLRRQGQPLHESIDYDINWDTLDLTFKNQDTYHTYNIIVCVNVEYINSLIKTLFNLK